MAFQEIRQVPSTPAKNGIKPWKKPSSLLHSHLLWAHTWWDTSQILSAFMISSHSSQQPCCSSMWLSVSHNGNNSFRNLKGSKRPPEFTQTATKVMYQLFRLVQELLWQAQCTRDPATKSTQPTTRRLERSRVGTWVFGIRHLLTGLKWSSAVIAGDFGLLAMFFFFLSELNTDSNEQFQESGCITPLPPHSASVKSSASSQTSIELFCLLPGIDYWGGWSAGEYLQAASQLLPSDATACDIMTASMGTEQHNCSRTGQLEHESSFVVWTIVIERNKRSC